jgi:hypothetical protein
MCIKRPRGRRDDVPSISVILPPIIDTPPKPLLPIFAPLSITLPPILAPPSVPAPPAVTVGISSSVSTASPFTRSCTEHFQNDEMEKYKELPAPPAQVEHKTICVRRKDGTRELKTILLGQNIPPRRVQSMEERGDKVARKFRWSEPGPSLLQVVENADGSCDSLPAKGHSTTAGPPSLWTIPLCECPPVQFGTPRIPAETGILGKPASVVEGPKNHPHPIRENQTKGVPLRRVILKKHNAKFEKGCRIHKAQLALEAYRRWEDSGCVGEAPEYDVNVLFRSKKRR